MTETPASLQDRDHAYSVAGPHSSIEGLFTFQGAAAILRISRALGELDASVVASAAVRGKKTALESFFERLDLVEQSLLSRKNTSEQEASSEARVRSVVVAVEGLDGSGKSSLVHGLTESLSRRQNNSRISTDDDVTSVAWATPTHSMALVRPVFDKRGGPVARAFYLVSNYFLQYDVQQLEQEILHQESHKKALLFVVVDRWYASTVAYSVAWKNTTGDAHAVDALDSAIFAWPPDLRTPDVLLLLQVDDEVRRERVKHRNNREEKDNKGFNPWDQRLNNDVLLGQRIQRAFDRVADENLQQSRIFRLNSNQTQEKVLQDSLQAVYQYIEPPRLANTIATVVHKMPLDVFRSVSADLGLCHERTGRRCYHAPWSCQLAWIHDLFPVMKTVGIHTVDSSGILFFTRQNPAMRTPTSASFVCVIGNYPTEHQWRGEGMIVPVEWSECQFLDLQPPPSLIACATACSEWDDAEELTLVHMQERLPNRAEVLRKDLPPFEMALAGYRFIPLRMEALIGGPSSPGGPLRYEWHRPNTSIGTCEHWSPARAILPFRNPDTSLPTCASGWKPVTVCITGTHCSGKTTVGKRLAAIFGWKFQAELGETMRDHSNLVAAGHRTGNGSGDGDVVSSSWDDQVYQAEVQRDGKTEDDETQRPCRVVETWHVGNLEWALMRVRARNNNLLGSDLTEKEFVARTKFAFQAELQRTVVIAVHLKVSPEDSLRRRLQDETNKARIPMESEREEGRELHEALDVQAQMHLAVFQKELGFPYLVIENTDDNAVDVTTERIVRFVNEQQWRRAA